MAGRLLHGDALMHDDLSDRDLDAHVGQNQNSANRKCELGIENDNAKDIVDARSVSNKTTPKRFSARIQEKTKNEKARLADQGVELSENTGQGSSRKKRKACRKMKGDLESSNKDDDQKKISKVISSTLESNAAADCVAALGAEPINPNADEVPQSGMASDRVSGDVTEKSDNARVKETLRSFNKYYLHFVQAEEQRCKKVTGERKKSKGSIEKAEQRCKKVAGERKKIEGSKGKKGGADKEDSKQSAKRPDLKAISKTLETNAVLYPEKRFGHIPGVAVGHQFFSRAEMVVVGLHGHWLKGIDYMGQSYCKGEYRGYTFPLAVAIVLSGQYEDDLDNWDEVVYTGQGGNNLLGNKRQVSDQVLERGNLALKNSFEQCVPVRVVRGHKSASSYVGKVYTYDGLYKVVHYWAEKGVSGYTVYKFRLKRLEGQPLLTTNQVHFSHGRIPKSISEIRGLVCEDITGGQEDIPIPATNLVEEPPVAPSGYTYCKSLQVSKNVKVPSNATGCSCKGSCVDPRACLCAKLNGSDFPYVHRDGGRLIEAKAVVFECGPRCGCGPGCVNRASQKGLKYRLEVFRTPRKGWAVRSWDYIPSGAPVCEYTGILMRTDELDNVSENNYIFEIDCLQTMKGLGGRESRSGDVSIPTSKILEKSDDQKAESPEFCIDAGPKGNIARFINHSCEPNLFVQCVLNSHHDVKLARVMLFAADSIPPMQELTYDYGYALDSVHGPDGKIMQMPCFCGATGCRKRLF